MKPVASLIIHDTYAPAQRMKKLKDIPALITHCREDDTVPFFLGEKLYDEYPGDKSFSEHHCSHIAGFKREENRRWLVEYLEKFRP